LEQVAKDGKKRKIKFYNLDMIIAVGYRINSKKATNFRRWAIKHKHRKLAPHKKCLGKFAALFYLL
jgi:hypothetical protein